MCAADEGVGGPALPQEVASDIVKEQSPRQLYTVRGKLYELLANCVPPDVILRTLLTELLARMDDEIKVRAWRGGVWCGVGRRRPKLGGGASA